MPPRQPWTPEDIDTLRQLYPDHYTDEVGRILGRNTRSVFAMAYKLGLHKSEAFRAMELQKQADRLRKVGKRNRFPKGHIPANKGVKMSAEVYEKAKPTMFKPGNLPHNTKYDGHTRLTKDGYIMVRIAKGKYVLEHRHLWEQHHGPIPPGHIIKFKDGNSQNITIDNLEMISTRDNMMRNNIHNYPPELQEVIKLNNRIKNKINAKK